MTEKSMLFRQVLGNFATGVAVVTTRHDNEYFGLTINSFTSVSLDPLLIQINIAKNTTSHDFIMASRVFTVNILAEDQRLISTVFSGAPPAERFDHVETRESDTGCPVILGSLAHIDTRVVATYDGGDHTIFLAEVLDMNTLREDAAPLLYFRGKYAAMHRGQEGSAGSA
ncbi:MAG: flavin reductase family protein [Bacteroidota bacterium]|nr:flavin reductase family protein [Bacteroidota bacterium]